MMLAEIQMLKQQIRKGSSLLYNTDSEKDALNNLIEANVRSGPITTTTTITTTTIIIIITITITKA
jgi:hypothetical protein